MAENSSIEWTDHTVSFWWGCEKVSAACTFCYADTISNRYGNDIWGKGKPRKKIKSAETTLLKLNRKAKEAGRIDRVFVNSMSDFFESDSGQSIIDHTGNPIDTTLNQMRAQAFELFDQCENLILMLLTKRPENIRRMWHQIGKPVMRKNVWIGTSVENQEQADKRIPELLNCRDLAANLFLSCEPLLGHLELGSWLGSKRVFVRNSNGIMSEFLSEIDWVIAGGESGPNARPSHPDWFRSLRDQCAAAGVPFHFKQWGEWFPLHGTGRPNTGEESEITPFCWVSPRGDVTGSGTQPDACMVRLGKKKAGRLLDAAEHNGLPLGELWIAKNV